jgi:hypothetical protein
LERVDWRLFTTLIGIRGGGHLLELEEGPFGRKFKNLFGHCLEPFPGPMFPTSPLPFSSPEASNPAKFQKDC